MEGWPVGDEHFFLFMDPEEEEGKYPTLFPYVIT